MDEQNFLPITKKHALALGWQEVDFVLVCGDAYVDHPSFGAALLGRMLQASGWRVGLLPQPDVEDPLAFMQYGRPRLAFLISGGVVDSMVAHYTSAKRRRRFDEYTAGGHIDKRPDRAVEVYAQLAKKAYADVPVVIGGVEASLRRFAHYDYWDDAVRPSILQTSGANVISYGMGEHSLREIAKRLNAGDKELHGIAGTAVMASFAQLPPSYTETASLQKVQTDKTAYAKACAAQLNSQDHLYSKPIVQKHGDRYLVQYPPAAPLNTEQLDEIYALPFTRRWHPVYDSQGGVPALEEVEFSIAHNRGCFGGCAFCAITMHQGRRVTSRSVQSVLAEGKKLTEMPNFKGYIHDVGGPTANFRGPSCDWQQTHAMCAGTKRCLAPTPCPKLKVDHSEYLDMLRRLRALPKVKKVFIRSGIRYDYVLQDKDDSFLKELVQHHVSGQLKVAPEHCSPAVLQAMGKPPIEVYNRFAKRFYAITKQLDKPQYLVPYLISGHPGSTLKSAVALAEWLHKNRIRPEQVQDFYPTPGSVATCMYYTGLDPFTLKPVHVAQTGEEKAMQRALLQYTLPKNRALVHAALLKAGRADLLPALLNMPAPKKQAPAAKGRSAAGQPRKAGRHASSRGRAATEPKGKRR